MEGPVILAGRTVGDLMVALGKLDPALRIMAYNDTAEEHMESITEIRITSRDDPDTWLYDKADHPYSTYGKDIGGHSFAVLYGYR